MKYETDWTDIGNQMLILQTKCQQSNGCGA